MIRLISRAFWLSLFVVLSSSSTLEPVKRTQNESIPIMSNSSSSSSNQTVRATKVASIPIIAENNNKTATTQPKNEILVPKGTVPPTEAPEIVGDRKALMDIYSRCNGPSWVGPKGIRTNWNTPNVCVWYGIKCDNTTGRVVFIDIEQRTMACDLPPSISALSALRTFDVAGGLLGTIPQAMSTWTSIRHLKLYQNDFSGTLPEFISKFTELKEFAVVPRSASIGRLTGTLPAYLEKLPLQILVLDANKLSGTVPAFIFKLKFFHLRDNEFTGPCGLPGELSGAVSIICPTSSNGNANNNMNNNYNAYNVTSAEGLAQFPSMQMNSFAANGSNTTTVGAPNPLAGYTINTGGNTLPTGDGNKFPSLVDSFQPHPGTTQEEDDYATYLSAGVVLVFVIAIAKRRSKARSKT
eukprot:PhF_6_TR624/c1_g1_i4/m.830